MSYNIAIFISGRGSNMKSIVKAIQNKEIPDTQIKIVLSDNKEAQGITYAKEKNIPVHLIHEPTYKTRLSSEIEEEIATLLLEKKVNLVCLAGYMRILKQPLLQAFPNKIINIHPSLLPKYPGLNVQKRAIEAKEQFSGCTVHLVDGGMDTGLILGQKKVPLLPDDTTQTLSARILEQEHLLYPQVIKKIVTGELLLP